MKQPLIDVHKIDPVFLSTLMVAIILVFFHLDHRPFWQDEAETACLARNVLKYGVPRAYDGVNLISQEEGQEYNSDYLWRWSPWLQIYLTAAAFQVAGPGTTTGRLPFAVAGVLSIFFVYRLAKRDFDNLGWARWAATLLASSVPFLLFARQCRYYSVGALLVILSLYAFRGNWQSRFGPAALLTLSMGLLFHTNYLLFFSYTVPFLIAALLVYPHKLPPARTLKLLLFGVLLILPGLVLFRIKQQVSMVAGLEKVWNNFLNSGAGILQFMIPLPLVFCMAWRWRPCLKGRAGFPEDPAERFVFFLSLIILGNFLLLLPLPQWEYRYLVHLYPLAAIIMGWLVWNAWRYHKFSGVLLGLLLLCTNWLNLLPMEWLRLIKRPIHNDVDMLTYPNLPLKNYLMELFSTYPDVNQNLINFFKTHARRGETVLVTYGDLPLQFYTSFRVLGGLQGRVPLPGELPEWVVQRWHTRWNREYGVNTSEEFILQNLQLSRDYQATVLSAEDEIYGNRADPYYHRFTPPRMTTPLTIYHLKRTQVTSNVP